MALNYLNLITLMELEIQMKEDGWQLTVVMELGESNTLSSANAMEQ